MKATRLCACGCETSLEGRRADCVYATGSCRTRAYLERRELPEAPKSFWRGVAAVRRPARARAA